MFDDILERKKTFLDYKNQKVKKVKNWDFSKGSMVLVKNFKNFPFFIFGKNREENVFGDILGREKDFLD